MDRCSNMKRPMIWILGLIAIPLQYVAVAARIDLAFTKGMIGTLIGGAHYIASRTALNRLLMICCKSKQKAVNNYKAKPLDGLFKWLLICCKSKSFTKGACVIMLGPEAVADDLAASDVHWIAVAAA